MADSAIFMGWGEPIRGREQVSATVFGEALELWARLEAEGAIESWPPVREAEIRTSGLLVSSCCG